MSNLRRTFVTLQTAENSAPSLVQKGEEWDKGSYQMFFTLQDVKLNFNS